MIIFDFMGHMTSTIGPEELHAYAKLLGLKREWYQTPGYGEAHAHYDLTTPRMRAKAARMGATLVDPLKLVKLAWWAENSRIEKKGGGQHPS